MWSIFKRELQGFFFTPLGYTLWGTFLLINGLLLWIFPSNFNILDAGFGDVNLFFELNPWLLIVLLPAMGMKSFSEEIKLGTLELLLTKPLSTVQLIVAKFTALAVLILISLSVALLYFGLIGNLLQVDDVLDWGIFWGSFTGLFFFALVLAAISLWASTLVESAFSAFLIAVFVSLFQYYGWGQLAALFNDYTTYHFFKSIGLQFHYSELNKGVIRLSNIVYLALQSGFFLWWTHLNLNQKSQ